MSVDTVCGMVLGALLTVVVEALFVAWLVRGQKDFKEYGD